MARPIDNQICFRLADAVPAASFPEQLRLGMHRPRRSPSCCRSSPAARNWASLAFARLGGWPIEDAARRALARVAERSSFMKQLLRGLRGALPAPAPDRELRRALIRFYHDIAQADIGLHLASIVALIPPFA